MTTAETIDTRSHRKQKVVVKREKSSCSVVFWGVFGAVIVLAFTRAFTTGNPEQHVERLWKIMRNGMVRTVAASSSQVV